MHMNLLRHEVVCFSRWGTGGGTGADSDVSAHMKINKGREEKGFTSSGFAKSLKRSMDTLDYHCKAVFKLNNILILNV